MVSKKKTVAIVAVTVIFCVVMALVDGVFKADYFTKSIIKLAVFLICPLVYSVFDKQLDVRTLFKPNKQGMRIALLLCIPVYIVIFGGYLLLKDVFDFSGITGALTGNIGVTGKNFIFVSLYISFVNSLLEEFFFRGFSFLTLRRVSSSKFAYIFSASVFSLYHVVMMIGWFSVGVFTIILIGLFIGGLIFNYLNDKSGTIYPSWFVHMFANFAINTVGFILFDII